MIGELIYDYALGRNGIVVGGAWIEPPDQGQYHGREIPWEWLILYDGGELIGADTGDLEVVE